MIEIPEKIASIDQSNLDAWQMVRSNPAQTQAIAQANLELSRNIDYAKGIAWSTANLSAAYTWLSEYELALKLNHEAIDLLHQSEEFHHEVQMLYNLSIIYYFLGDFEKQIQHCKESLDLAQEIGDKSGEANALNGIGTALYSNGKNEEAIEILKKGLDLAIEIDDKATLSKILDGLGQAHIHLNELEKALEYKYQCLEIVNKTGVRQVQSFAHNGIGEIYRGLNNFPKALEHFLESRKIRKEMGFRAGEAGTTVDIATTYKMAGDNLSAVQFYKEALAIAENIGSSDLISKSHKGLSELYEDMGNLTLFVKHFKAYHEAELKHSSEKENKKLKAFELKGRLDQIQKEKEELQQKNELLERHFNDVKTLSSIGLEISSTLDIESIFSILYERIQLLTEAEGIFIGICNYEEQKLEVKLAINKGVRDSYFEYSLNDDKLPVFAINNDQEIHINNYEEEIENYIKGGEQVVREAPGSVVIIPLRVKDTIIGALLTESSAVEAFTDHHVNILRSLASSLSIALDNAWLYEVMEEKVDSRTRELAQTYESTHLLNKIGQELISTLNFEAIFGKLYESVNELMDASILGVRLVDEEKGLINYAYEFENKKRIEGISVSINDKNSLTAWTVRNKEAIITNNITADFHKYVDSVVTFGDDAPMSNIFYPLIKGDKVLGVLTIQSLPENAYQEKEINIVKTLSNYIVIAISNATIYEEMEAKVDARTAEIKQSYENTKLLSDLGKDIGSELSSKDIINKVYKGVNDLMDASVFGIGVFQKESNSLLFSGAIEKGEMLKDFTQKLDEEKMSSICFKSGVEIVINDWKTEYVNHVKDDYVPDQGDSPDSMIYMPLISKDQVIGVLTIQSFNKNSYSDYHVNILKSLSVYIAGALENASLYQEMEERVVERTDELKRSYETAEMLSNIGQELISTLNFEDVFKRLYENVNKLMDATIFGVRLYDPEKQEVQYLYEYENGKRHAEIIVPMDQVNNYSVWSVMHNKEIFINDNELEYKRYVEEIVVVDGDFPYSLIFYPLRKGDEVKGVISVQSFERNAYEERDLNIVKTLAHYTVIALDNARNYEIMEAAVAERTAEVVKQKEEIEKTFEDTKLLSKIGRDITSQLTVERIIETVYAEINKLMDAEGFGIGIFDTSEETISFPGYIESGERLTGGTYQLDEVNRPAVRCYANNEEIIINDFEKEYSSFTDQYVKPKMGRSVTSFIYLPLKTKDKTIGVITVQSFNKNAYSEYHVNIMRTIAIYSAIALDNASLYEHMEDMVKERTLEVVRQKEEIEKTYQDTKLLSQISKDISQSLAIDTIISRLYDSVNAIMKATSFGIGILDEEKNALFIPGFIENNQKLENFYLSLDNERLATICFTQEREIFINDYFTEYKNYISELKTPVSGKDSASIIYLPLYLKGKVFGLLTVQSYEPNEYTEYHLNILRNLANSIASAIENARLYENMEEKVRERTAELLEQKEIIEEKNKHITDSIRYAKRIQDATLPDIEMVSQYLDDSFVLFKPKDIVSGDFYWIEKVGSKILFAVVDCTGHGVPGAFLSLIGHNSLNQIVNELKIHQPSEILDELNIMITRALNSNFSQSTEKIKDGMDMAICSLDIESNELCFAGAYNPLYLIRNNMMQEIKGDKIAIGSGTTDQKYVNHVIHLEKGDCVYLFSDGYADQFGGPKGKKFKYSKFKELLVQIHQKEMDEQHRMLDKMIDAWQGDLEQIDDICVIGARV